MSATEAQLGLEFKLELECALESEFECGFEFELNHHHFCLGIRVPAQLPNWPQNDSRTDPKMTPRTVQAQLPNGPEKDHFGQLTKNHHTVGDSLLKCKFASILTHSPSPLKLPPLIP